jgi:hypothetical protein
MKLPKLDPSTKIIKEVCANTQANLATHNQIQTAIKVVEAELEKPPKK